MEIQIVVTDVTMMALNNIIFNSEILHTLLHTLIST